MKIPWLQNLRPPRQGATLAEISIDNITDFLTNRYTSITFLGMQIFKIPKYSEFYRIHVNRLLSCNSFKEQFEAGKITLLSPHTKAFKAMIRRYVLDVYDAYCELKGFSPVEPSYIEIFPINTFHIKAIPELSPIELPAIEPASIKEPICITSNMVM